MRKIRVLGVCLAAVFGVCAMASASAMASEPPAEYKKCVTAPKNAVTKKYEGEFDGKLCSSTPTKAEIESAEKTGKKYDLVEAVAGETGTVVGGATSIYADKILVTCKRTKGTDEIIDQFEGSEKLTLTECSRKVGTTLEPCGTAGTIETNLLRNELHFINAAETEAGVALSAESGVVTEYSCGTTKVVVEGVVLGSVVNSAKGVTFTFATNTKKEQVHKTAWIFGEEVGEVSLVSGSEQASLKAKLTQGPPLVHVYTS